MQELRCPNDNKKLAEVRDDSFMAARGKEDRPDKGMLLIKCPKCKQIIGF